MKIDSSEAAELKSRWKIVRTDNYADIPGDIVTADEVTGECVLLLPDGNGGTMCKTLAFGPHGIKIISRRR
jgi:hypothetical protein